MNSPDQTVIPQDIADNSEYRRLPTNEDPLKEAARPPVHVVRKLLKDERGGFKSGVVIGLGIGAVFFLSTLLSQVTYNQGREQGLLEALRTPTPAITTQVEAQIDSKQPIIEVKPYNGLLRSYQGEITILPSDNLKPSKTNEKMLSENRSLVNLVAWENIVEIEGVPIKDAEMLKVKNPVLASAREKKANGGLADLPNNPSSYNYYLLAKLNAVIKNPLGQLEKRDVFYPINTPESQGFVNGFNGKGSFINVFQKGDQFSHRPNWGEKNLGPIAANQVEVVTAE